MEQNEQVTSDETYDYICRPCSRGGEEKEAKHYCQECREYLCDKCKDYHRKLRVTEKHSILSGCDVPHPSSTSSGLFTLCGCKRSQEAESYCEDHLEIVCRPCKTFTHHKCKTSSLEEKGSCYKVSSFESLLAKTKELKDKFDLLKQESLGYYAEMELLKCMCKNEIKKFRKELDSFLDTLEKDMLEEINKYSHLQIRAIDEHIIAVRTAQEMLDSDYKLLEDAKLDGRKEKMFVSEVQVSKAIQLCEIRLADLEKDDIRPCMSFKRNKKLADLESNTIKFGSLKVKGNIGYQSDQVKKTNIRRGDKKMLPGRKIQTYLQVSAKSAEDIYNPLISGGTLMPNGYALLCDRNNHKIKLLDRAWVLRSSLEFLDLWDISVIDDQSVMVSIPKARQLQFVQVFPQITAGRTIQLDKRCWGVAVSRDEIYITCHNDPGEGEVRILDLNGNCRKRLGVSMDGAFMFIAPNFITVSGSAEKVFVSDEKESIITCMSVDGRIVYKYSDDDMKSPKGLYCDSGDNILVCGWGTHSVQVITSKGKKFDTLLSYNDRFNYPSPINLKQSDDTVIIGCVLFDNMQLFKLED